MGYVLLFLLSSPVSSTGATLSLPVSRRSVYVAGCRGSDASASLMSGVAVSKTREKGRLGLALEQHMVGREDLRMALEKTQEVSGLE